MSRTRRFRLVHGLASLCLVACGGAGPGAHEPTAPSAHEDGASAPSTTNESSAVAIEGTAVSATTPAPAPLSSVPECDAYLRLYRRCEPSLAPSIAAGDRRDFVHERGWLEYLAGTPEVAGMPTACRDMTRELQAICP